MVNDPSWFTKRGVRCIQIPVTDTGYIVLTIEQAKIVKHALNSIDLEIPLYKIDPGKTDHGECGDR